MSPWRFMVLGYQVGFARPVLLILLLLAAVLGLLAFIAAARRRTRIAEVVNARFAERLTPGVSVGRPVLSGGLTTLALLAFGLALAQPQCGASSELTRKQGIDVVVAIDASKSMLAKDVQPSRLERAKIELTTLLDQLKGDRVGIVIFAGDAFVQCPLTSDYEAAKLFLRAVNPAQLPQGGTNIGAALKLAKKVLEGAERAATEKVVVLISDGEDFGGEVDNAIDGLKELDAPVFAIGIGSDQGEPIPIYGKNGEPQGFRKDALGNTILTRLDRTGLQRIAERTGGELFHEQRGVAMGGVLERIDRLQKSELESRRVVRYAEAYQPFLLVGVVAYAFALLIPTSRRRRP